jgi:putative ABC transport system permease protein
MFFFMFVLKNIVRRPVRSLLTIIGLAVAVTAVDSLVGISQGFESSFRDLYINRGVDIVVTSSGSAQQLNSTVNEDLGPRIERLDGIKAAKGGLMDVVTFPDYNLYSVIVQGWEPEGPLFDNITLKEGHKLKKGEKGVQGDGKVAMVGTLLAMNTQKKLGDYIEVYPGEQFEIVGTFETFSQFETGSVIIPLKELQRLMGKAGKVNGFTITTHVNGDRKRIEELCREIEKLDSRLNAMPTDEFARSLSHIELAQAMAWVTSVIALVVGAVGMLNTMFMSVFERTREIGTLRAIGWRKRQVVRMIVVEAVLISVAGAALGTLGAIGLTKIISEVPTLSGLIESKISKGVVAQGFGIAAIMGIVGAAYPAYWGARLAPTVALRHE